MQKVFSTQLNLNINLSVFLFKTPLDAGMWRYHANRMDARRRKFDIGRVDAYI